MAGSLMTVAKELSKYELDLEEVQEVTWNRGVTKSEGKYSSFREKKKE
jgi:hypothetical protein